MRSSAVLDVIHERRAVRSYTPQRVEEAKIRQLLDAAVHAPTAMHLEPWSFVVVQNRDVLERLCERAKTLVGADPRLTMLHRPDFHVFYDASTLIVICGPTSGPFVTADCWLAAQNLMLAAVALDLGTCVIGLAVKAFDDAEVRRELAIPDGTTAIAPIIVGYPRAAQPHVSRKPPHLLSWIR